VYKSSLISNKIKKMRKHWRLMGSTWASVPSVPSVEVRRPADDLGQFSLYECCLLIPMSVLDCILIGFKQVCKKIASS